MGNMYTQQQQQPQQQQQVMTQQLWTPQAGKGQQLYWQKGKAGGKWKGKGKGKTPWSLPQPDPSLPIAWECGHCGAQHNHDTCWVCRNIYCKAPRPDPNATWYDPSHNVGPANAKGKGMATASIAACAE